MNACYSTSTERCKLTLILKANQYETKTNNPCVNKYKLLFMIVYTTQTSHR